MVLKRIKNTMKFNHLTFLLDLVKRLSTLDGEWLDTLPPSTTLLLLTRTADCVEAVLLSRCIFSST